MAGVPADLRNRIAAKVGLVPAWTRLRRTMRREGAAAELWIGDSHAMSFVTKVGPAMFLRGPRGSLILRVGTRLMYSLSHKGFPALIEPVVGRVERMGKKDAFLPIFVSGEIDVRNQLASRPDESFGFVEDYVDRCVELAARLHASRLALVVPPPPHDEAEAWWPIVGSASERVEMFSRLRTALEQAVSRRDNVGLLDFTDLIADDAGLLDRRYTDDGCHTNLVAVAKIADAFESRLQAAFAPTEQRAVPTSSDG